MNRKNAIRLLFATLLFVLPIQISAQGKYEVVCTYNPDGGMGSDNFAVSFPTIGINFPSTTLQELATSTGRVSQTKSLTWIDFPEVIIGTVTIIPKNGSGNKVQTQKYTLDHSALDNGCFYYTWSERTGDMGAYGGLYRTIYPYFGITYNGNNIVCSNNAEGKFSLKLTDSQIYCNTTVKLKIRNTAFPSNIELSYEYITKNVSGNIIEISPDELPDRFKNNEEMYICVVRPDNTLSEELSGFYCLTPPELNFKDDKQPTCYEAEDASVTAVFPNRPGIDNFLLTIKRYSNQGNNNSDDIITYPKGSTHIYKLRTM